MHAPDEARHRVRTSLYGSRTRGTPYLATVFNPVSGAHAVAYVWAQHLTQGCVRAARWPPGQWRGATQRARVDLVCSRGAQRVLRYGDMEYVMLHLIFIYLMPGEGLTPPKDG